MDPPRLMILCAGFGTRLQPLSEERPKPLVPFGDRTLLEHVLEVFGAEGLLPAVVNAHHLAPLFREMTQGWSSLSHVLEERTILGTAGGLAGAAAVLAPGPVLVTNGDVVAKVSGRAVLERTADEGLCLAVVRRPAGTGPVGLGARGEVVRLRGERFGPEVAGADYVCTMGVGARVRESLPETGCLIGDVALPLARRGGPLTTWTLDAPWSAPGDSVLDYWRENLAWLAKRYGATGSFVAADARVARGVVLESSLVGAGAELRGEGKLERVVVWPGARAAAPLADAVVTTAGRIVRLQSGG